MNDKQFDREKRKVIEMIEERFLKPYYAKYEEYIKVMRQNTGQEPPGKYEEWLKELKNARRLGFWDKELGRLSYEEPTFVFEWGKAKFRIHVYLVSMFTFWKQLKRTSTDFLLKEEWEMGEINGE